MRLIYFVFLIFSQISLAAFEQPRFEAVYTGFGFYCGVMKDKLSCWGQNGNLQAIELTGINTFKKVGLSFGYGCAIDDEGVFCWGKKAPEVLPEQTGAGITDFTTTDDRLCSIRDSKVQCNNSLDQEFFGQFSTVKKIGLNSFSTCALKGQEVFCKNQMELPRNFGPIADLYFFDTRSCLVNTRSEILCWNKAGVQVSYNPGFEVISMAAAKGICALGLRGEFACKDEEIDLPQDFGRIIHLDLYRGTEGDKVCVTNEKQEFHCTEKWYRAVTVQEVKLLIPTSRSLVFVDQEDHLFANKYLFSSAPIKAQNLTSFSTRQDNLCYVDDLGAHCVGEDYPSNSNPFPTEGAEVRSVELGYKSICALTKDGQVKCTGDQSMLPPEALTEIVQIVSGNNFYCTLSKLGIVSCWGRETKVQTPTLDPNKKIKMLAGAARYACVLFEDQSVECWGDPAYLQASPTHFTQMEKIVGSGSYICAYGGGEVFCWGSNHYKQLETPRIVGPIRQLALAATYGCLIDAQGMKCWGSNDWGEQQFFSGPSRQTTLP